MQKLNAKRPYLRFFVLLMVLIIGFLSFSIFGGCDLREMFREKTKRNILRDINSAGGIEIVNNEAQMAFTNIYKLEDRGLSSLIIGHENLTEYPALNSLGQWVLLYPETERNPRYIKIMRGGHRFVHILWIFDPDIDETRLTYWEGSIFHVTNNIYMTR